ncbi:hypothetical protein GCM10010967_28190 [Dyadobacter beijingensis]|uniref:TraB family protein n=1 Tax=Dyadobacter beijingensis TaxID=365489 RepID=A0ABQ2HYZ8_9BACT|nr:TraB/GumN family protein [Dyadobacter beijingensis]GGM93413.1 hypothetical protein GCM10010967_28190 [Dyadobacter beijingensis]
MRNIVLSMALVLTTSVILLAQQSESVLWKITGNGIAKPSYLFGTLHIASITLLDSFPTLRQIAESADMALFESLGSPIGQVPEQLKDDQPPLDSLFTPEEYAKVDSFFTASPLGSMRPHNDNADLLAMVQAAMTMIENKTQYDRFDDLIFEKMINLKKPAFHLDNPLHVQKVIDGLGYRRLAKFLVHLIESHTSLAESGPEIGIDFTLYSQKLQNPLVLNEQPTEQVAQATVERNAHWIPKIEEKLKEGSCFIAVGLEHLKYQTGLIELLRRKGYTLRPVKL